MKYLLLQEVHRTRSGWGCLGRGGAWGNPGDGWLGMVAERSQ